jgi:glycosyltransferase XagB
LPLEGTLVQSSLLEFAVATTLALLAAVIMIPACTNLWWMLHAWRTPEVHEGTAGPVPAGAPGTSFSVIVPFRHEREDVVRTTVKRLVSQTHGDVQVVLSVGHDDPDSVEIAERLAAQWPDQVIVSIDTSEQKSKPRQLNTALRACTREYVSIFDAESLAHPELFAYAEAKLVEGGYEVLQAGVQLVNHRTTWFALRNCMEYFFWFRSRLHLHARHGFIPLGGNTLFVKRSLVVDFGGWDEDCLTEDADLGVRLSSRGVDVGVIYDPRLVTREESPDSVKAMIRQRSRWNQGFLQVLAKGDWRSMPTRRQRVLARYTLVQPYLQALTFVTLPIAVVAAVWATLPLPITMFTFLPLVPTLGTVLLEGAGLREFGRDLELKIGVRDYVVLFLSTVPFHVLLSYSALRGLIRHWQGREEWEKTPHTGHHLVTSSSTPAEAPAAAGAA